MRLQLFQVHLCFGIFKTIPQQAYLKLCLNADSILLYFCRKSITNDEKSDSAYRKSASLQTLCFI